MRTKTPRSDARSRGGTVPTAGRDRAPDGQDAAPSAKPAAPAGRSPGPARSTAEAEKARTEIAAGDVADDLADFA